MENQDYVFDLNSTPESLDPKELINMMKQQKIMPMDTTNPTITMVNHIHDTTVYNAPPVTPASYAQGIWSQMNQKATYFDPNAQHKSVLQRMDELELANKLLRVEIQVLKGKFTEEEGNNIKAMLTSNDEASITVAETILETT